MKWLAGLCLVGLIACRPVGQPAEVGLGPRAEAQERMLAEALAGLEFVNGRVRPQRESRPLVDPAQALAAVEAHRSAGRPFEAIAAAAQAVRALPTEPRALAALASALRSRSRWIEAEAALRTALDQVPADPRLRHELALVLQARGEIEAARDEWRRVLATTPDFGPAHARLAVLLALVGESEPAREQVRRATALGSPPPPQLAHLGAPAAVLEAQLPGPLPPVRVDTGGTSQAAEAQISGDGSAQTLIAGWNDLRQAGPGGEWRLGVATSLDGGASWTDRILRSPAGLADDFEGDPMVVQDPRTGHQWVGGVLFGYVRQRPSQLYVARRQAGSHNLLPAVAVNQATFVDKGLLAAGPRPGLPNTTRLYVAYNLGVQFSDDLGATWSTVRDLNGGISHTPRVGPGGVFYVVDWDLNLAYRVHRSTDGGATFEAPRTVATRLDLWSTVETTHVPGKFRVPPLPAFAVDPTTGTLYVVYPDTTGVAGAEENVDLYFTRSTNGGVSWSTPVVIHGDSSPSRDQFQPWLEVGADGRLHLAFFDTRSTPQLDADPNAFVDVWYATSTDGGTTWSERRITTTPFETRFALWPGFDDQFLGDYLGLHPAGQTVRLLYPTTQAGNLDMVSQTLDFGRIFDDGFESGGTGAWSVVVP